MNEARFMRLIIWAAMAWLTTTTFAATAENLTPRVPENVYHGQLLSFPGPWSFLLGRSAIILVTDEELEALTDPDRPVNLSLGTTPHEQSLRQICTAAQAAGQRTLIIAFDHFFAQYRAGQDKPRRLTPDTDEYIRHIATISKFAQQFGLGLELSLLSPLEIGPAYARQTGESGVWMHYRKGLRDPKTGDYSVQLWRQTVWANNKGPLEIKDAGVRVFAFRERAIPGTPYLVVNPTEIVEISDTAEVEVWPNTVRRVGDGGAVRVRIHGRGRADLGPLDRVLVVQIYHTPEMDYFSEKALPYLNNLTDKYVDASVKFNGLYADEMHIQQDWAYFGHHDHGEFALRYVSPGLIRQFAERYGEPYRDFAKYLVYFVHGQEDVAGDLSAKGDFQHVWGDSAEAVRETALFRSRYYRLLQDGVVDLFTAAKRHLEGRIGYQLESRAHATWAESPTIDHWRTGRQHPTAHQYEYTSNFVWSNTVHQAASACHDYFKWGDFLTGNGNDHAECGWLDRNYVGLMLACSTGILNDIPYSYGAHWGMPDVISRRRQALVNTFGAAAAAHYGMVQGMQHRDTEVLMLYPLDLVAVDERFGSWMTQYAYANQITQAKLLERGKVVNGAVEVAGRKFTTLVTLFEPFPDRELLNMMRQLLESGGRVVWAGSPPVLLAEGQPALPLWKELFGVEYAPEYEEGLLAPGREVIFDGVLKGIAPMTILTDLLVDHVFPVSPRAGVEPVARVKQWVVGTYRAFDGGGSATFLGFRPRDDQSKSLGYEARWWFEILHALGSYPSTGSFADVNDNPEYISRTTKYLACRFPNGAVAVAPHLCDVEECWPGGFARDQAQDEAILKNLALPSEQISLKGFKVNGHTVTYEGAQAVTFRVDKENRLAAFCGEHSREITIDGRTTVFAEKPVGLVAWAPVEENCRTDAGTLAIIVVYGQGTLRIPVVDWPPQVHLVAQGPTLGSRGRIVPGQIEGDALVFTLAPESPKGWFYVLPGPAPDQP